jgi:hypothetical protein
LFPQEVAVHETPRDLAPIPAFPQQHFPPEPWQAHAQVVVSAGDWRGAAAINANSARSPAAISRQGIRNL